MCSAIRLSNGLGLRTHRPGGHRAPNVMLKAKGARQLSILGLELAATEDLVLSVVSATDRAGLAPTPARLDPPTSAMTYDDCMKRNLQRTFRTCSKQCCTAQGSGLSGILS